MCMQHQHTCFCGKNSAHLNFRDNILTPAILLNLYCPECSSQASWEEEAMVSDCGWVMEYDIIAAQVCFQQRGLKDHVTPELLLDEGYLSWQGFSPTDLETNAALHRRLEPLIKEDMSRYLQALKSEWLAHVAKLKAAGWRKAQKG